MSPQTFDFGAGPVPAHRHRNPDGTEGGWVANTATVPPTVRIGYYAQIGCNARIRNGARIGDYAQIGDYARIDQRSDLVTIDGLGAFRWPLTAHRTATGYQINAGCWSGSLPEMVANLSDPEAHWPYVSDGERARIVDEYLLVVPLLQAKVNQWADPQGEPG